MHPRIQRKPWQTTAWTDAQALAKKYGALLSGRSGQVLQEAAPLVFQAMCHKEGINVTFTEKPKTDGSTIWLGPIDLANPLAPIFVFGHGCHERHHVVHTDFKALQSEEATPMIKVLTNVFEDIRVDTIGASEYEGYLLWREALFGVMEDLSKAPWQHLAEKPSPIQHLLIWLLVWLTVHELKVTMLDKPLADLRLRVTSLFGRELIDAIEAEVEASFPLSSTAQAVELAHRVLGLLHQSEENIEQLLSQLEGDLQTTLKNHKPVVFMGVQGALFSESGEVTAEGMAVPVSEELLQARQIAASLESMYEFKGDLLTQNMLQAGVDAIQTMMTTYTSGELEPNIGQMENALVDKADWPGGEEQLRPYEKRFHQLWKHSNRLIGIMQDALRHKIPQLVGQSSRGYELMDDELWRVGCAQDEIFCQYRQERGRDLDLVILLDTSGSMELETISLAKVLSLRLYEALSQMHGTDVTLGLFPGTTRRGVTLAALPHTSVFDIGSRISRAPGIGPTPIQQALFWAASRLISSRREEKLIFVITDGWFEREPLEMFMKTLKSQNIEVALLAVGQDATPAGEFTVKVPNMLAAPKGIQSIIKQWRDRHH